ncbi:formimidoylglutamase [Xanthocytophaga flava]|uniref:formimidoylglutamase n=1 Tax=Xanthocytophaga flava TaxID=3048013 RepID=UPI0028D3889C|nr:formimidoylglutamase [Xanthocytophaga flavus]MDJ1471379.1 formimidoylglutamase [Xanthocytophaga flavus]
MKHFYAYEAVDSKPYIRYREGETKLGEQIVISKAGIANNCQFVLLGIKEDIGVKANLGVGGANTVWDSFLSAFLNIQSTDLFTGKEVQLLGYFDFTEPVHSSDPYIYRKQVEDIDSEVEALVMDIVKQNKIPIVIGGSHANAYPIIKGVYMGLQHLHPLSHPSINCINLDAHADFRRKEGRHSGNGFRYAYEEKFLKKYAIVSLHENYNPQTIITEIKQNADIWFCFWEDIFLREKLSFKDAVYSAIEFTNDTLTGIELDLDCMEDVLSSAMTPSGISATLARWYLYTTALQCTVAYLHICEGATQLTDGRKDPTTGKLISYLVSDFVKGFLEK